MERMSASPLQATAVAPLERMGLMALLRLQPAPAGPRHTRQVPTSNCVGRAGRPGTARARAWRRRRRRHRHR